MQTPAYGPVHAPRARAYDRRHGTRTTYVRAWQRRTYSTYGNDNDGRQIIVVVLLLFNNRRTRRRRSPGHNNRTVDIGQHTHCTRAELWATVNILDVSTRTAPERRLRDGPVRRRYRYGPISTRFVRWPALPGSLADLRARYCCPANGERKIALVNGDRPLSGPGNTGASWRNLISKKKKQKNPRDLLVTGSRAKALALLVSPSKRTFVPCVDRKFQSRAQNRQTHSAPRC